MRRAARIVIDGAAEEAPVVAVTWPPDELVGMWLEALRTFIAQRKTQEPPTPSGPAWMNDKMR